MDKLLMANWITMHSFLSLNWDEWGSIVAILTAIVLILRWALNKAHKQLFEPVNRAIHELKISVDKSSSRLARSEDRLEREDKILVRHDEELKDHERRITNLEERK